MYFYKMIFFFQNAQTETNSGPPKDPLFSLYRVLFRKGMKLICMSLKFTIYLYLVPRLRTSAAAPYSPCSPSWHAQGQLNLYYEFDKPVLKE
jgi:hypothetical protein